MRCLNSPATLNSLEAKIVETAPSDARHILVVNAGDGRLARAIREKVGGEATVSVVTLQPGLVKFVDDFPAAGAKPWDLTWHAAQVSAHGAYDFVVFYQLHEFWHGELHALQVVLAHAKPGAVVWTSFLNAQSPRMIGRFLPPVRLGSYALADPIRFAANVDFASYMDFIVKMGGAIAELWGLLDHNAQKFCHKVPAKRVMWETRGIKVSIGTLADAFLWGAAVTAVAVQLRGGSSAPRAPRVSFSPYSGALFQALMLPYPDEQTNEGTLGAAHFEIEAWRQAPAEKLGTLAQLLVSQAGDADKPRRVLLVGSGWGRDLLLLKRKFPAWDWVGFDHNLELLSLGGKLLGAERATAVGAAMGEALPFGDGEFDLAFSVGYFSSLYEPAARHVAKEVRRVTKGAIYHIEDGRGPDHSMQLKAYSLKAIYSELGSESSVQPVLVDGKPNGLYIVKVALAT